MSVNERSRNVSGIQTPRSPLGKIGNLQMTSPNSRISIQKVNSPVRYKSVIQAPMSPRLSTELPLLSQLNPNVRS